MEQLLTKYTRYIAIIASHPDESAVPTLDVDLAWHTHQLSPKSYLDFTAKATGGTFIDHNDRVDEEKLSTAFEWTCKVYMEKYGEPYSECTCWYCESVRVMNVSGLSKVFRSSKEEKGKYAFPFFKPLDDLSPSTSSLVHLLIVFTGLEQWHASGASSRVPQPPTSPSAHLSAHPSIQVNETIGRRANSRMIRFTHRNKLQDAHSKAVKKGPQRGVVMGPRGRDEVEFWGKTYRVDSPVLSELAKVTTPVMYASPPGVLEQEKGSCARGTCGGSGGCGSETLALCTAGCTGVSNTISYIYGANSSSQGGVGSMAGCVG